MFVQKIYTNVHTLIQLCTVNKIPDAKKYFMKNLNKTSLQTYLLEFTSIGTNASFTTCVVFEESIIQCTFFKAFNVVKIYNPKLNLLIFIKLNVEAAHVI